MDGLKTWQKVLAVVALVVLAGSLWFTFFSGDRVRLASRVYLIDVVSGDVFVADISGRRSVIIPAKNPETGERTIVPVERMENGDHVVSSRYRELAYEILQQRNVSLSDVIESNTWKINARLDRAPTYRRP